MVNDWVFEVVLTGVMLLCGALAAIAMLRMRSARFPDTVTAVPSVSELPGVAEHASAALWMTRIDDARLVFANAACTAVFGGQAVHAESFERDVHPEDVARLGIALAEGTVIGRYEVDYRSQGSGRDRYIRESGQAVCDESGVPRFMVSSALDISDEMAVRDELHALNAQLREANLRLRENARRDSLTQCLNRMAFLDQAEKALHMEQRYGRSSTLIFFDLNDFKQLNDNFGHHIGDRGLIEFAQHIRTRLRTTDELGRYGGDEFVVLLRETDATQAAQLLTSLLPVVIDAENGNSIILRYSAGIACSDEAGIDSVDDWLRCADSQMYHQKMRRSSG